MICREILIMAEEIKSYYAILPAEVRYDKELSASEKLLFAEITALSNENGYCYASNNYFAQLYNIYPSTVSKWVTHLKEKGYIDVELIYDNKEIKERHISIIKGSVKMPIGVVHQEQEVVHKEQEVVHKEQEVVHLEQGGSAFGAIGSAFGAIGSAFGAIGSAKTAKRIINNNNKQEYINNTIPKGIVAVSGSTSKKTSQEERYKKALETDTKDIGAIFYYIDHLQKSKEFREALKKWYNAVGKGFHLEQLKMKLDDLYKLFTEEKDQIDRINLCYKGNYPTFVFKTDKPESHLTPKKTAEDDKKIQAFSEEEKRKEEDNVTFSDFV